MADINTLIGEIQKGRPKQTNIFDVYSPEKQQQQIINNQRIQQNELILEKERRKAEIDELERQQDKILNRNFEDLFESHRHDSSLQNKEEFGSVQELFQLRLGTSEAYARSGRYEEAVEEKARAFDLLRKFDEQKTAFAKSMAFSDNASAIEVGNEIYGTDIQPRKANSGRSGGRTKTEKKEPVYIKEKGKMVVSEMSEIEQARYAASGAPIMSFRDAKKKVGTIEKDTMMQKKYGGVPTVSDVAREILGSDTIVHENSNTIQNTAPTGGKRRDLKKEEANRRLIQNVRIRKAE